MKTFRNLLLTLSILTLFFLPLWSAAGSSGTNPTHTFSFETNSNKPYVQVNINESDPFWFVIDTGSGAGSIIARDTADTIGLEIVDEKLQLGMGAGEGAEVTSGSTMDIILNVQGLQITRGSTPVISLEHVSAFEGRALEGTVGSELFNAFVVEIDYESGRIALYDPEGYSYQGTGRGIQFRLQWGMPIVYAELNLAGKPPIAGRFIVDTGSRMTLLLSTPFVVRNSLLESDVEFHEATVGGGVGGESKGYVGRIDSIILGPYMLPEPIAILSTDKSGVLSSDAIDGIIGGGFLTRTTVIFDYSRGMMYIEPRNTEPEPYEYDMSGLFLVALGDDFDSYEILSVMMSSPAADAGLERGDVIIAIDDRPSEDLNLEEVRKMFKLEGKKYELTVTRGDHELTVKLKTRRII